MNTKNRSLGAITRKAAIGIGVVVAGLTILFLTGPRVKIDLEVRPLALPADLDQYLRQSEALFPDIVPDCEKKIVWSTSAKTKTGISIVYLHGFSASRQETTPLCDELADQLGANLYYARLTGHGRSAAALAKATVNDWINDAYEALEIGRQLGDRVIVIGSSTGATLATWLAGQTRTSENVIYVLMSPNFAPKDSITEVLNWPWARQFAPLLMGADFSWKPANLEHGRYWTQSYPTIGLLPMMGLVKCVREGDLESIENPVLVIYSPSDRVVNPQETEHRFAQFGSKAKKIIPITYSVNKGNHVLAGDILAPNNTQNIKDLIIEFISSLDEPSKPLVRH